jgi:hypothetical protein
VKFALVILAALGGIANAAPLKVADDTAGYRLTLPDGWTTLPEAVSGDTIAAFTHPDGAKLVIVKHVVDSADAWAGKDAFFAEVSKGLASSSPGYTKLSESRRTLGANKTPALDVWFVRTRPGGLAAELHGVRFLFPRGYALSAVLVDPSRTRVDNGVKLLLDGFQPWK